MFGLETIPLGAWAAVGLVGYVTAAAVFATRSWPIAVRRALRVLTERVDAAEANVEGLQSKLSAKIVELGALTEEIEGMLGSIEKKRRRIAASESQEKLRAEREEPDDPYLELRRRARAAGHPV